MNRLEIANIILEKLTSEEHALALMYDDTKKNIGYFFIDDLLPETLAKQIYHCFPDAKEMRLKKSIREYKFIAAQMNNYNPILEETTYAFQDPRVVELISNICKIKQLSPDEHL